MDSDEALLAAWRGGDQDAGRALLARHFRPLYRFFSNKCADPDDMVQDTFLAVVKARDQFGGRSSFRTYLYTIARNRLYQHLRTLQRAGTFDPDLSSIAELVSTAGSKLARGEDHRRLCAALRTLPIEQQTLLELHYWDELDASALAEVFHSNPAAIRNRLLRARNSLRAALEAALAAPPQALATVDTLDQWARSLDT